MNPLMNPTMNRRALVRLDGRDVGVIDETPEGFSFRYLEDWLTSSEAVAVSLTMPLREQADAGRPTVVSDPDSEVSGIYKSVARQVAIKIAQRAKDFSSKFPTITISKTT